MSQVERVDMADAFPPPYHPLTDYSSLPSPPAYHPAQHSEADEHLDDEKASLSGPHDPLVIRLDSEEKTTETDEEKNPLMDLIIHANVLGLCSWGCGMGVIYFAASGIAKGPRPPILAVMAYNLACVCRTHPMANHD
jgi:hypothetical protein